MLINFRKTVHAITETILTEGGLPFQPADSTRVSGFVLSQHGRMPDFLRLAVRLVTVFFDTWPLLTRGRPFHRLPAAERWRRFRGWKHSRLAWRRDFARYYESLVIFGAASLTHAPTD